MKLQNAKSPEMARFLSMMLNERKCAWERRVIAGQKSEERAKHVDERITWLEKFMDSDNVSCIVQNTVSKVEENDIILMHDYYESSVMAALEIIDELKKEGYEFVTVEEILFD